MLPEKCSFKLPPGPKLSPLQQHASDLVVGNIAERARRRTQQNTDMRLPGEKLESIRRCLERVDIDQLRKAIQGDLAMAETGEWGENARATAAFLYQQLDFHPNIPLELLKQLDLDSWTLLKDVLALATGTFQDVGFFIEGEGGKRIGFDDITLRALQAELGATPREEELGKA